MSAVLVFDLETIPDVAGLRRLHNLPASLADEDVAELAFQRRRAQGQSDFLPLYLHRVVSISCLLRDEQGLQLSSLAEPDYDEAALLQGFFDLIARHTPQIVSWNGAGFDLPVLNYRGLMHGVHAARYWDCGEGGFADSAEFIANNYINAAHTRHIDLMAVLAMQQKRASAPLDGLAKLMGMPGKHGMQGSQIWAAWQAGQREQIRDYCESDVVNTYLLFLRWQKMRGALSPAAYQQDIDQLKAMLEQRPGEHWRTFLSAWSG